MNSGVSDVPWGQKHKRCTFSRPFLLGWSLSLCTDNNLLFLKSCNQVLPGITTFLGWLVRAKQVENLCGLWLLEHLCLKCISVSFWPCGLGAGCLICPFPPSSKGGMVIFTLQSHVKPLAQKLAESRTQYLVAVRVAVHVECYKLSQCTVSKRREG